MAEQVIQVPPDSTGKKVRTQEITAGANTVEMETVVLADPTTSANLAGVTAGGALKVDASATTQPISGSVTATQATGTNLHVVVDTAPTTTVTGTVTANQGTANATPWNENVAQFGGTNVVTGTGVSGAGIPRVTVSSDSFPATQPISGAVTVSNTGFNVNNFPLNPSGEVRVDASQTPIAIRDSVGEDLYGTNNNLNVHLAGNEIFNLDGSGNLGVNVQSGTVAVLGVVPVSLAAAPLAVGASLETGNLAVVAQQTQFEPQVPDLLKQILAQLQILNMNFSSYSSFVGASTIDDQDSAVSSLIQ